MHLIYELILEYLLIFLLKIKSFITRTPPASWKNGTKGDVIILTGFAETWIYEETIASYLNNKGYRIHVVPELDYNFLPIQKAASFVTEYIQKHNLTHVILLAHSKGGLIGKLVIDAVPQEKIKCMISISVPFQGTFLGTARVLNLYEMLPSSVIITSVLENKKNNNRIYNLYPTLDNHVWPNKNLLLPDAHNIHVDVIGHTRILHSQKTLEVINSIV